MSPTARPIPCCCEAVASVNLISGRTAEIRGGYCRPNGTAVERVRLVPDTEQKVCSKFKFRLSALTGTFSQRSVDGRHRAVTVSVGCWRVLEQLRIAKKRKKQREIKGKKRPVMECTPSYLPRVCLGASRYQPESFLPGESTAYTLLMLVRPFSL